jgi:hypothetical protein
MASRISKLTRSLKEIGEIQVNEWDFAGLMNKEIRELEFRASLRKLGNVQVMDWDFRNVLPVVSKLANTQVDLADIVRRTAHCKVLDWDFNASSSAESEPHPPATSQPVETNLSKVEMRALIARLKSFIQYLCTNLVDVPNHANIEIKEIKPSVLRVKVILVKRDVAMLIGREGHTAAAVRSALKAAAGIYGVHTLLEIVSHEDQQVD